jgi:hypothetical protein
VKPLAGTPSCEVAHLGVCLSGRMRIRMNDGTEAEVGPGEVLQIDPGHDAWVVGSEPCVILDFAGMEHYAERPAGRGRGAEPSQPGMH